MQQQLGPTVLASASGEGQYLTFTLGSEVFAIAILGIKEIIEYATSTPVPMMPEHVRGVINLRGAAVPVIDLHSIFKRAPSAVSRRTCVVIVETQHGDERRDIGVVVDSVNAVVDIAAGDIEPPPKLAGCAPSPLLSGMAKMQDRFVILLNIEKAVAAAGDLPPGDFEMPAAANL